MIDDLIRSVVISASERARPQARISNTGEKGQTIQGFLSQVLRKNALLTRIGRPPTGGGPRSFIVLICLGYVGMHEPDGTSMELDGPRFDLSILLQHLDFRHWSFEPRRFKIISDFSTSFTDGHGVTAMVPTIPPTRRNVEYVIREAMRNLERNGKCLIYFSGRFGLDATEGRPAAQMAISETEYVSGTELRSWLGQSRSDHSEITVVLDACHSSGFLALPYRYEGGEVQGEHHGGPEIYNNRISSRVIQIASSRTDAQAQAVGPISLSEGSYGALTWALLQHIKKNSQQDLRDLAFRLSTAFQAMRGTGLDREGTQIPVVSSSRKIKGKIGLF